MLKRRRKARAQNLASDLGAAAVHTGITLWYRWPILVNAKASRRKRRDAAELDLMVSEKIKAASDGIVAGHAEAMRLAAAAMTGKLRAADWPAASTSIVHAALRPALRKVESNAGRLRRRHMRRAILNKLMWWR
jgi:hypothetical protein